MKLASVYANFDTIFPRIVFHEGINVIFGHVKEENIKKDSHNLGKTFLITVIDFCLLADVKKEHPFKSNNELFKDFEFYIELETNEGRFITIKRRVNTPTKIYIHTTAKEQGRVLTGLSDSEWSHSSLSLEKAKDVVDGLLKLSDISPFPFRKGLSHIMRRQNDYNDEFRTSKFIQSKDMYWKPYILKILGFDESILDKKYQTDSSLESSKNILKVFEADAGYKNEEYDEIRGVLEVTEEKIKKMKREISGFDFRELDEFVTNEMVYEVETRISKLNEQKYKAEATIREIETTLRSSFSFDVNRIKRLFKEAAIAFEGQLEKSYNDLIEFNKSLSVARNERLQQQLDLERGNIDRTTLEIKVLTDKRYMLVSNLLETQTLEKYRSYQMKILEEEREALTLRGKLESLDKAGITAKEISTIKKERITDIENVKVEIRKANNTYSDIRKKFASLASDILDTSAILSVNVNDEGNPEFKVVTKDDKRETNEGLGTSYRKILCACFDLSIAAAHSKGSFYRYLYHDGIFEGLDNRKKVNLLSNIRKICEQESIQYIFTIIDSDLPRDKPDSERLFHLDEIVRTLDDSGDEGRLFRMQKF